MHKYNPVTQDPKFSDDDYPATMQPIIINNNGEKLLGTFFVTGGKGPHPTVLLLHGFPGNEVNYDLAHSLRRSGCNVVVFHYRGSWGSSGCFTFTNSLDDLTSAVDFLKMEKTVEEFRINIEEFLLIGHSLGGFAALLKSLDYSDIKNVVSIAGFNFGQFAELLLLDGDIREITLESLKYSSTIVNCADAETLYNEMINNRVSWNLINQSNKFKDKNILLIGAANDSVSPVEIHHTPLVKSFISEEVRVESKIFECGHSFSDKRITLAETIIDWINKNRN